MNTTNPIIKWGSDNNYEELYNKFNILKNVFTDKGIPIIIGESGIITSHNNISYFREFIYAFFSLFSDFDGIMACLWDSTKYSENMYYYNRENGKWNDEVIKNSILKVSKGKNIKSLEYYIKTKVENIKIYVDTWFLNIENRKIVKIDMNVKLFGKLGKDFDFGIGYIDKNDEYAEIIFKKKNGKKQYDGTTIFTLDLHNVIIKQFIISTIYYGYENIIFNNVTAEYEEEFNTFNYKSYKIAILNEIN